MPHMGPRDAPLRLDASRSDALQRAAKLIEQAWASFDHARPEEPPLDARVRTLLGTALPERPSGVDEVLDDAARILDESLAQPRPRYFAFIGSSGLEIGVIGDAIAAAYDVNLAVDARAATQVERQAIRWAAEFLGYDPDAAGAFTSGGTVSNTTALAAARERALPGARRDGLGGRHAALYASADAHYSVVRAGEMLGIGSANVRAIPIDAERRLIPEALEAAIDEDRARGVTPVAVIGTAGTTLVGAIDPLDAIADICAERGVWFHVDGAYGLPAAAVVPERFRGFERADSVSVDAHKWLYLPKACGVVLVRREADLRLAFSHHEGYLHQEAEEVNAVDTTLEYSRPFRALKFWLAFRAHGAGEFRAAIGRNLAEARFLADLVREHDDLELAVDPMLSVVPFRHLPANGADIDAHNRALSRAIVGDGRVYVASATIDDAVYQRPCFVNYRTTDDDVRALVDVVRELGTRVARA